MNLTIDDFKVGDLVRFKTNDITMVVYSVFKHQPGKWFQKYSADTVIVTGESLVSCRKYYLNYSPYELEKVEEEADD